MSTENIVKNKYYRILKDKTNSIWDRISFWTHADDVELTGGATLSSDLTAKQTKIDATQTDFAQVETSPTTHAYIRGQMLLYNNQLYRVKQTIAVGATLTVGTNIEAVSVSTLSSMLTATNGNGFYFDYKDGTPGFYPTASKTASQFVPFGGTDFKALFPLSLSVRIGVNPGSYGNASASGFVIPLHGINHINITRTGGGSWSFSNGISIGNNIDVSSLNYITAHGGRDGNESLTSSVTISIVD